MVLYVTQVPECGLMFRSLILWTGKSEMAGHVIQFLWLQGFVPTTPIFRAIYLTLTSLFLRLDAVRLTKFNIRGCGVESSVLLHLAKLGEEESTGSNCSSILRRFESLPYVVITLAVWGGEAVGVMTEADDLLWGSLRILSMDKT